MMGKLIIIDGISNAGKTTLCNSLENEDIILIEEVPKFIAKHFEEYGLKLSSSMPKSIEEEKINQNLLFSAEIDRLKYSLELIQNGKSVILDRSFLGTVAVAYAFDEKNNFRGSYDNAKELLKNYLLFLTELFQENEVFIYFLDVDSANINERNLNHIKPLAQEWINEEFLNKQRDFFNAISLSLNAQIINTSNLQISDIIDIIDHSTGGLKR